MTLLKESLMSCQHRAQIKTVSQFDPVAAGLQLNSQPHEVPYVKGKGTDEE